MTDASAPTRQQATRILHVLGSLDRGGAETVALDLARRIPSEQVRQAFVCLSGREGELADEFRAAGAEVYALPLRPLVTFGPRFVGLIRDWKPDGVVSHVSVASAPLLLVARFCRVRQRVARMHSQGDGRGAGRARELYRAGMRLLMPYAATHVLGVTRSSLTFGLGRSVARARARGVRVAVLPNGVDGDRFTPPALPPPDEPLVVVHVGRAAPEKNRRALPAILSELEHYGPAEIRLVGARTLEDIDSGAERLTVVGPTDDVPAELQGAHVSILPSLWEGLPGVVLESLACGTPVVASDLPGVREIAEDCVGVTTVPVEAPAAEWARAVRTAAVHGPSRTAVRSALLVSRYTVASSVRQWTLLWDEAATPHGAARARVSTS